MAATPSSLRTPRILNGSPVYRSYPGCDLEPSSMIVDDVAYKTHVVGAQPVVHQGNQFTQPVWRDSTLSPFSPISPTEQLFGNSINQKRRRIQPVSVIHNGMGPAPAAATATTAPAGARVSEAE
ncbi:hypothetical protein EC988_009774 [Linderina pennispora]|nr:hypothetical protein EC988_009774 [Linderina pennispora]